jgi:hypothetical protein
MINIIHLVIIIMILCMSNTTYAQETTESGRLLRGANSIQLASKINDSPDCQIGIADLSVRLQYRISQTNTLRIVAPGSLPDLVATVLVESTEGRDSGGILICAYYINLRAIHPMYGGLRYRSTPGLLQVLVFNKSIFGVARPENLESAIARYTEIVVQFLLDEHFRANASLDAPAVK